MGVCSSAPKVVTPLPPPPPPTPTPTPPPTLTPTPPPTPPLRQDVVEIRIDKSTDENKVDCTKESYPDPEPPENKTDHIKPKDRWFEDDDFNNASDDADLVDMKTLLDEDVSIYFDTFGPGVRNNRPKAPATVAKPALVFDDVDDHAKQADPGLLDSFQALVDYLKEPWASDKYRLIKTARAIVAWLSVQPLETTEYGEASLNTPTGILQYLKTEKMSYPTCYAILCRKAELQCVIIKGYVKAAGYEPGDVTVPDAKWNAVYGEYGWQLVHPFWICRALYGHKLGGWVKVESDGQSVQQTEKRSEGVVCSTFQERYFMPKPKEYVYECYTDDTAWQLVKQGQEVSSRTEFLEMAYLLPPFHGLDLQLMSTNACALQTVGGTCKIEFKGRTTSSHMLHLKYELFRKDMDTVQDTDSTSRMVFNSRANETFTFDIRFPEEGIYKLVIYGGPYKAPSALRLCEFKIECKQKMRGCNLLPLDGREIGWGPGPATLEAGLLMPSKPSGVIAVNKKPSTAGNVKKEKPLTSEIKFRLRDDFIKKRQYSVSIHGEVPGRHKTGDADGPTSEWQDHHKKVQTIEESDVVCAVDDEVKSNYISTRITKELMLIVVVTLPAEGEYGVTIRAADTSAIEGSGKAGATTVCNYLMSTLKYDTKIANANVRLAKNALSVACEEEVDGELMKKKIANIDQALDKCRQQRVPDNDETVCVAEMTREYLMCKDLLRDCHLRRNEHAIRKALAVLSRYKNKAALMKEIKKVERLRKKLNAPEE